MREEKTWQHCQPLQSQLEICQCQSSFFLQCTNNQKEKIIPYTKMYGMTEMMAFPRKREISRRKVPRFLLGALLLTQLLRSFAFQYPPIVLGPRRTPHQSISRSGSTRMQHWRHHATKSTDSTLSPSHDLNDATGPYPRQRVVACRRSFIATITTMGTISMTPPPSLGSLGQENQSVEVIVEGQFASPLGIQLKEIQKGDGSTILLVENASATQRSNGIRNGMILENFSTYSELQRGIQHGPYPLRLRFRASDDSLLARLGSDSVYKITVMQPPAAQTCTLLSKRDDVLEINYEAKFEGLRQDGPTLLTYDSSASRGTGQPYQTVLGSGDMLPGVDQGLYNMCVGEKRRIIIPPPLAYGSKGNKIFRVPPDQTLIWEVELVAINGERTP